MHSETDNKTTDHTVLMNYGVIAIATFGFVFTILFFYQISSWDFQFSRTGWRGLNELVTAYSINFKNTTYNTYWKSTFDNEMSLVSKNITEYQRIVWTSNVTDDTYAREKTPPLAFTELFAYSKRFDRNGGFRVTTRCNNTMMTRIDMQPCGKTVIGNTIVEEMLTVNGPVYSSEGYFTLSDRKSKKYIQSITPSETDAILNGLEPIKYNYNGKEGIHYGFISGDVKRVLPDSVKSVTFKTQNDHQKIYDSMNYDHIIAILVQKIKTMSATIDMLKLQNKLYL